jgi:hypothetical protein
VLAHGDRRLGYPRTTGPLTGYSWEGLGHALADNRTLDPGERRCWRNAHPPSNEGLRHVSDYLQRCRSAARRFLGHEEMGPIIHELVCGDGYEIVLPSGMPEPPAVWGHRASSMAAYISGAPWVVGATALLPAWERIRPSDVSSETFTFIKELSGATGQQGQ